MHASLHHGHGNLAGLADHELSSMTDRGRTRKCRNVSVRNADSVGKIVSKRSQARAQHQPDLRAQRRLRKYECCGGFSASKQVWEHGSTSESPDQNFFSNSVKAVSSCHCTRARSLAPINFWHFPETRSPDALPSAQTVARRNPRPSPQRLSPGIKLCSRLSRAMRFSSAYDNP